MQAQAKVTKIVGYGAPAIRDALQRGIISGDMKRHCEAVVQENERLKQALNRKDRQMQLMQRDMDAMRKAADDMLQVRMAVYQNMVEGKYNVRKERRRWGDLPQVLAGVAIGAVMVAAVALVVMVG